MRAKIIFGAISAIFLLAIFALILFAVLGKIGKNANRDQTDGTTAPIFGPPAKNTSVTGGTLAIRGSDGSILTVRDFAHDPATTADPSGENYGILAGGTDPLGTGSPYQIAYDGDSQTFSIILYKLPLAVNRFQAEQVLMQKTGLSQSEMCRLNSFVNVIPGVADQYLHQNLGFSFCPGSTPL